MAPTKTTVSKEGAPKQPNGKVSSFQTFLCGRWRKTFPCGSRSLSSALPLSPVGSPFLAQTLFQLLLANLGCSQLNVPISVLGTFALPALTINVFRVLHFHFWLEKLNFKSEVSLKTSSSCTALVCNWGEGALVQRCLFSGCRILRTSYSRNIPAPVVSRLFNPVN